MIHDNIIGYTLSGKSGRKLSSFNPEKLEMNPESFSIATQDEVNEAVEKAHQAWRRYRYVSGADKAIFLRSIADGIENLGDHLIRTIQSETAYPVARIIVERTRTCAQLRMFADLISDSSWKEITIDKAIPDRAPSPRPELMRMMMPIGPVVVFGASNFPLAYSTAGGDVASALAVGCPVIVKAHESHPATNALVAEVIMNAAQTCMMPDGVFSTVYGDSTDTGKWLVQHPLTAAVGFTGSLRGGRALFDLGNQRDKPIPVFAEMGSVNPIFILPSIIRSDADQLIAKLVSSMTMTVGQFCTNPGIHVLIDDENTTSFITSLTKALEDVKAQPMLNQGIAQSFHKGIETMNNRKEITTVLNQNTPGQLASAVLAFTNASTFLTNKILHHEIFGPFALIVRCANKEEMESVAHALEGQLTASVFHSQGEEEFVMDLVSILVEKAGRVIANGVPTGVEVVASMTHGGPYPATTDARFTAVGHFAIRRWLRPVTFQNFGKDLLRRITF
jgi:NADP-dependent aldehyde dehydrogenase